MPTRRTFDGRGVVRLRAVGDNWRADFSYGPLLDSCGVVWQTVVKHGEMYCEIEPSQLLPLVNGIAGNVVLHRACASCGDRYQVTRRFD